MFPKDELFPFKSSKIYQAPQPKRFFPRKFVKLDNTYASRLKCTKDKNPISTGTKNELGKENFTTSLGLKTLGVSR